MRLQFNEQDLVDSVSVFVAQRDGVAPHNLVVELFFNERYGFSATSETRDGYHRYTLSEQDLIDAVAIYLAENHNFDSRSLSIELLFEEGIGFSALVDRSNY